MPSDTNIPPSEPIKKDAMTMMLIQALFQTSPYFSFITHVRALYRGIFTLLVSKEVIIP